MMLFKKYFALDCFLSVLQNFLQFPSWIDKFQSLSDFEA